MKRFIEKIVGYKLQKRKAGFHYCPNLYGASWDKLIDIRDNKEFYELATKVIKSGKTCLKYDRLFTFYQLIKQLKPKNILEAGGFRGGSVYFMASLAPEATVYAVDTFEGFKAEDEPDGHNSVGVFGDVDYEDVKSYFKPLRNVTAIKSRIQELRFVEHEYLEYGIFDLIHLDMDIFLPTKFALENTRAKVIVVDDYNTKSCVGVTKAVDEFCGKNKNFLQLDLLNGQCLIIKI